LLTGSARHVNLDVIRYAKTGLNLRHLEKIAGLIERRAPIPDNPELERVEPKLDDYSFPRALFPDLRVQKALSKKGQIRSDLITPGSGGAILDYKAPWTDNNLIEANSVDVILSQAVMQSVEDLATVYATLHKWLKPGGMMSHSIDFGSLGMADTWDGHRAYGDTLWALLSGGRPYSLNRLTLSGHLELLADLDFELMLIKPVFEATHVPRDKLAVRFRRLDEQDLRTRTAFIIARKRG
jgi:hypothetical protein